MFGGDVEESNRSSADEKFRRRDEIVGRQLGNGDKNEIGGNYNRGACRDECVRWSDRPDRSALRCVCGLAAQSGGLACSRPDPRQRRVIFIHAVEIDHGLASHLVGPDPVVGDQLVSLSLSEFSIATTVLELGEPAPIAVTIVDGGFFMCFDVLRDNRIKFRRARRAFPRRDLGVAPRLRGGRCFCGSRRDSC